MTSHEVKDYLRMKFPEVEVEKMESRFPKLYSSFKITIDETNIDEAMNPELWPEGAMVNRFFHQRKIRKLIS